MPNSTSPTLEEVYAAFQNLNIPSAQAALTGLTPKAVAADPGSITGKICPIYQAVRKVLEIVLALPFLPAVVKTGIQTFISLMDLLCPPPK